MFSVTVALLLGSSAHAHAEPTPAEIEKQIDAQWLQLEPIIEQHNETKLKIAIEQKKANELNTQLAPLELQLELTRTRASYYAAFVYRGGRAVELNSMLGTRNATNFAQRLQSLDMVARSSNGRIADVVAAKAKLDEIKKPLDDLIAQLAAVEAEQAAKAKAIDAEIKNLNALRLKAYGGGSGIGELRPVPCPTSYPGGPNGEAVKFACAQIGKPYVWGSAGPNSFDCSGLTKAAWAKAGVTLPHNAKAQRSAIRSVTRAELMPGDLVFYYSDLHHVAMYAGDGWIVHASQTGVPIKMRKMDAAPVHSYGRPG